MLISEKADLVRGKWLSKFDHPGTLASDEIGDSRLKVLRLLVSNTSD
jgi:hypothetical protein